MSSQVLTWIKTNLNMLHRQYIFEIWVQNYYFFLIYANFFKKKCWETIVLPDLSRVAIGFGCDTDMGFEETVEESDIVKTEIETDLFDLAVSDLQLALGVRNDGFDDDVTGSSLSDGFDGGTEVR